MATDQPKWKLIANLGDVNPVDYGGYFVFRDTTKVSPEEGEYWDVPEEESEPIVVYRFPLDRCTEIDGIVSDNKFHPEHKAWFADSLDDIANTVDVGDIRALLCSGKPLDRADAYRAIGRYYGFDNLKLGRIF